MYQKVLSYVKEHHMIEKGDHVIAGVSGGADSVSLLLVLERMREEVGFELEIVHIEHGIRGEDSLSDAHFVEKLCMDKNLPFRMEQVQALDIARKNGMSVEEAARALRYGIFEKRALELKNEFPESNVKIAVAHNENDQAETLILNLVRGSGVNGLGAIKPVRGEVIRPLLTVSRAEIEQYLGERHQVYCTDVTNEDQTYTRNKIRHGILPLLEELNAGAVDHLAGTAAVMQETEDYLARQTAEAQSDCVTEADGRVLIRKTEYDKYPEIIKKRLLHEAIALIAGRKKDITREHVMILLELMKKQSGRMAALCYGITAERNYDGVLLKMEEQKEQEIRNGEEAFSFRIIKAVPHMEIPKKKYTKWFDYDKINSNLQVRNRQEKDYFMLDESGKDQKLKNFFINQKIPREEREKIPLLCDDHHVVWIVGYRISSYYKVTEDTKNILEVQFNGGNES